MILLLSEFGNFDCFIGSRIVNIGSLGWLLIQGINSPTKKILALYNFSHCHTASQPQSHRDRSFLQDKFIKIKL